MLLDVETPNRNRLLFLLALVPTVAAIGLGAVWPSLFTLVALFLLPAVPALGVVTLKPSLVFGRRRLRSYLQVSVVAALASLLLEAGWLAFRA